MHTIRPRDSLNLLDAIAQREGLDLEAIDIVPSIQAWCEEHNLPEPNPNRMGKTVRNPSFFMNSRMPRMTRRQKSTATHGLFHGSPPMPANSALNRTRRHAVSR
jgi:hypothetical protein